MRQAGKAGPARRSLIAAAVMAVLIAARAMADVDDSTLSNEKAGDDWGSWGRTYSEQRFSPLDQINKGNVGRLGLAWTLELPEAWNVSSQPLEVDGVIYLAVSFTRVYAVDAVSGKQLWTFDAQVDPLKMRMAWGVRGLAFYKGKVIVGTQDGRLIALDAKTGGKVWETLTIAPGDNQYITGAPRVYNGKVIIGQGGADFPHVRSYVGAYDAETGKPLWRWYVLPGDPAKGFETPELAEAAKTWTGEWWKFGGGGGVWNAITYDPELNRVYLGTGNGDPWNRKLRSPGGGDNLFLCSVVALDADTGKYIWHYQTTPGETWDFDSSEDIVLATLPIDGKPRKVILHAPKNGFFYVIDRETGKLISAEKAGKVTWADHVDLATGRPVELPGVRYEDGEALIWPGSGGLHNWQPMSFSPDTGLTYIPAHEMAGYYHDKGFTPSNFDVDKDGPLGIHGFYDDVPKSAGSSSLLAWDPLRQKKAWETPTPGANNGGVISTRGGLVFQGQADGNLVAHDASTGATLWSAYLGVGTLAPPLTYSVGGKQYVSILAGFAGGPTLLGSLSAQHGWVGTGHPRRLLTFVLDGKAPLPPSPPPSQPTPVDDPAFVVDPKKAAEGRELYTRCLICHGTAVVAGGYAPDLRASRIPLNATAFASVVHGGLQAGGMPPFPELTDEQLADLQHYIRQQARYKPSAWTQIKTAWHFICLMIKMKLMALGWIKPG